MKRDMEQFRHFRTVFVEEDRETGKVAQKPCLFARQSRRVQLDSRTASASLSRAMKSRTRATKSHACDIGLAEQNSSINAAPAACCAQLEMQTMDGSNPTTGHE